MADLQELRRIKSLKAKVLVCHGGADKFVGEQEVAAFKKGMDSVGADYAFKVYPNAHPCIYQSRCYANGKKFNMPIEYNETADKESWEDMKSFFNKYLSNKNLLA